MERRRAYSRAEAEEEQRRNRNRSNESGLLSKLVTGGLVVYSLYQLWSAYNAAMEEQERQSEVVFTAPNRRPRVQFPPGFDSLTQAEVKQRVAECYQLRQAERYSKLESSLQRRRNSARSGNESNSTLEEFVTSYADAVTEEEGRKRLTDEEVDRCFCPITQCLMVNPVRASDGHTYEADALHMWFREHCTSPLTNLELPNKNMTPDEDIQDLLVRLSEAVKGVN